MDLGLTAGQALGWWGTIDRDHHAESLLSASNAMQVTF